MQLNVNLSAREIAAEMQNDASFGAEVIEQFLQDLGRHPDEFARTANFRMCRVMMAESLRKLATAIESS